MSIDNVYVSLSMFTVRKSIRAMLRLNNPSVPLGMFAFKAAAPFPFEQHQFRSGLNCVCVLGY